MSQSPSASPVGYVPNSGRGTVDLVTSCVFTLSLCVWSAIHMNVRRVETGGWKRFSQKLQWAVLASFVPEYVLWTAMQQFLSARELYKQRNQTALTDEAESAPESSTTPAVESAHSNCPVVAFRPDGHREPWTLYHGYFALMGGIVLKVKEELKIKDNDGRDCMTITPWGVLRLTQWNMLPDIPKVEIDARCKSDGVAKGLICVQVSWFFIQTIARKVAGLPITFLELNTLAHIGCAVALYMIWWFKPQDVTVPFTVDFTACDQCHYILRGNNFGARGLIAETLNKETIEDVGHFSSVAQVVLVSALSLLYGGVHAIVWNAGFPSIAEQRLWRIASCLVGGEGFILALSLWKGASLEVGSRPYVITVGFVVVLLVPYLLGRLYLVTESFISVRSLPHGAYDTVAWVNFVPHV